MKKRKRVSSQRAHWRVLRSTPIIDTYYCKVVKEKVETSTGTILEDYYLVTRRDVVLILPVTKDGRFVLIKEYKHGIGEEILMPPAGLIDKGETLEETALKELREETGYVSDRVEKLAEFYEFPSNDTHKVHVFMVRGLPRKPQKEISRGEETRNIYVTKRKLKDLLHSNKIKLATAASALYLALEKVKDK